MFGNGVAIGMTIIVRIAKRILRDHRMVVAAFFAVVAIATKLHTVAYRIVKMTNRRSISATSASELFVFHSVIKNDLRNGVVFYCPYYP